MLVLFSRNGVYTLSFIHMLTFFHYCISVFVYFYTIYKIYFWKWLFLECVAGLNDRKGCIFTNDMKLTRQNMKYFVFILSAMKYKSK